MSKEFLNTAWRQPSDREPPGQKMVWTRQGSASLQWGDSAYLLAQKPRMKNAISISEIIGTIDDDEVEVCAAAEATYDRAKGRVIVNLNAFARRVSVRGHGELVSESWLPAREEVTEHLPREEVDSFAKDVFHSWAQKVRAAVPETLHLHE